jgi:hypothetical protein
VSLAGDYSRWFRDVIKNGELAEVAAAIESDAALDAPSSRQRVLEELSRRYTAPARARGAEATRYDASPPA